MDKENELWKFAAVRPKSHNNSILSFLAPRTGALAKAVWITTLRERCSGTLLLPSPTTDITPLPHPTASVTLCTATCRAGLRPAPKQMALDRMAACQSWICSPCCKSCVYGICAFVLRCFFSVLRLYSKWSIVWGLNIFFSSSLSSCKSCIFLNTLSSCSVYPVVICMLCMYGQVDG